MFIRRYIKNYFVPFLKHKLCSCNHLDVYYCCALKTVCDGEKCELNTCIAGKEGGKAITCYLSITISICTNRVRLMNCHKRSQLARGASLTIIHLQTDTYTHTHASRHSGHCLLLLLLLLCCVINCRAKRMKK